MTQYDVIIIGAGAAGLMCAAQAARRGKRVVILDHGKKIAEKIRISGGGRCNFTNIHTRPEAYLSKNKHFCRSALSRYTPHDFIQMVDRHNIKWHEKKLGQLFCDDSAQQIIDMLVDEATGAGAELLMQTTIENVAHDGHARYEVSTSRGPFSAASLVIATGGLSIPKIGATGFGYQVARQFNVPVLPTRAGLVPLTFTDDMAARCKILTGLSVEARISCEGASFAEGMLFTHRGLSGPSILQISSYWQEGHEISINMAQDINVLALLKERKQHNPKQEIHNIISEFVPKRLAMVICEETTIQGRVADLSDKKLQQISDHIQAWRVKPNGSEGYRTAEVTLGGIDTNALSSQTMAVNKQPGLYFVGEVVDVTGHLGGYNFQWAWASAYAAAQAF
jgi:predicted Rossmann fold flavoprotein